jgi:hypothetical protein
MRLKRVEGQLRGIQAMIEASGDCEKVAQQLSASRRALDKAFFNVIAAASSPRPKARATTTRSGAFATRRSCSPSSAEARPHSGGAKPPQRSRESTSKQMSANAELPPKAAASSKCSSASSEIRAGVFSSDCGT